MKLNRWQVDTLYNLVAAEVRTVSAERQELIKSNDKWADNDSLRRELQKLILLKTKLDRLRKGDDLRKEKHGIRSSKDRQ